MASITSLSRLKVRAVVSKSAGDDSGKLFSICCTFGSDEKRLTLAMSIPVQAALSTISRDRRSSICSASSADTGLPNRKP